MRIVCKVAVVVPVQNEARFIAATLSSLMPKSDWSFDWSLTVMDGGSDDGTVSEVIEFARKSTHGNRISLQENPGRTQPCAVNLAAQIAEADGCDVLVQCDAHGVYPKDFVARVVRKLAQTGAASVVIGMDSRSCDGRWFSTAAAAAQNSVLGNGGSAHRNRAPSGYVDHGHHAAFDLATFRELGGYDETFRTNFDGEYDFRMAKAGKRVWLDTEDSFTYFVRDDCVSLARQYFGHGRGRAMTVLKHRGIRIRQVLPVFVTLGNLGALLMAMWLPLMLIVPGVAVAGALAAGAALGRQGGAARLAGIPATVMHNAWGAGFLTTCVRTMFSSR